MTMFLFAIAFAIFGGINPFFSLLKNNPGRYVAGTAVRMVVLFLAGLFYSYFFLPALTGPFWGMTTPILSGLALNLVVSSIELFLADKSGASHDYEVDISSVLYPASLLLLFGGTGILSCSLFNSDARYQMIGEVKEVNPDTTLKPLSLDHIRVVAQEQAAWKGDKVIAEAGESYGSKFHPSKYNAQRVGDKLYWVSFLEYNAFRHWTTSDGTPGYILVSAEEIERKGELIDKDPEGNPLKLRYMDEAYFSDYLNRRIYQDYKSYIISDIHREIDDDMKPWWVVTLTRPTQLYAVEKVELVLLVDPVDGKIDEYAVDQVPDWVDRVYPEALVTKYLEWYGCYAKGWFNSWWGKDNVVKPTVSGEKSLRLVWGADGKCYWFTGMTSVASSDQALVSFVLVDTRTGEASVYRTSGIDESAALDAANSKVSNYGNWHGSDCVLYYLFGEWAYVIPVLDDNGIFQRLAIVRLDSGEVALGKTQGEAMREFQRIQTTSGDFDATETGNYREFQIVITHKFGDVQDGRTVYYIEDRENYPGSVFTGTSNLSSFLPTASVGDRALIGVVDTEQNELPIQKFERVSN